MVISIGRCVPVVFGHQETSAAQRPTKLRGPVPGRVAPAPAGRAAGGGAAAAEVSIGSAGSVDQIANGYEAALTCTAEGATSTERVRMAVSGQTMRLTWLNRDNAVVTLTKCTTLEDTPAAEP